MKRRTTIAAIALLALLAAAAALETSAPYRWITHLVVVDQRPEAADVIYVLNGRFGVRADLAARLYHEGVAPRILLAHTREQVPRRPGRTERTLSELTASAIVERGVPPSAVEIIAFPGGVVDTRDEARALRQFVERDGARSVAVVTTDYHTGRARRTIRRELRGTGVTVRMAAAPDDRGITPANWWESPEGRRRYGGELIKQIAVVLGLGRAGR